MRQRCIVSDADKAHPRQLCTRSGVRGFLIKIRVRNIGVETQSVTFNRSKNEDGCNIAMCQWLKSKFLIDAVVY